MILDIRTIPAGHSVVSQTTELSAYKEDLPPFSEKVVCEAAIDRSGQILYVHLQFKGTFTLECSRCCRPYAYPISSALRLVVKEQPGRSGPSIEDESVDFFYDNRNPDVDLGPAIYEEIMTSLPLKPLCSEECTGVEIHTENVRVIDKNENNDAIDPRWEALKKIKHRL
jgi:uncharacterized protein